jgi:hypothetical protein
MQPALRRAADKSAARNACGCAFLQLSASQSRYALI